MRQRKGANSIEATFVSVRGLLFVCMSEDVIAFGWRLPTMQRKIYRCILRRIVQRSYFFM
jgi:hypothetical protein